MQIGAEIKRMREALGISQMKLAEEVGVSFQQIQKYEKGISKISVDRIQQIASALGVSVHTFFDKEKAPVVSEPASKYSPQRRLIEQALLPLNPEEVQLLQLFRKIDSRMIREGLIKQLRGIIELKHLEE
jgi:transcriptional regulator with XRE-family HTH domain